jgi:hypothetical protein
LDTISTKRQKVPMVARRWVLLSSINFPSMTLTTNSIALALAVGYFEFKI